MTQLAKSADAHSPEKNRGARPEAGGSAKGIAPVLLFALFVVLLLLVLAMGLRSFAAEVTASNASKDARLSVGFIANTVRGLDSTGFVRTGEGPEGKALVLVEHVSVGDFETRIYKHDGNLVQEYAPADAPYSPEAAVAMFPTEKFEFFVERGMLTVDTDQGDASVALRSVRPLDETGGGADPADGDIISEEVVLL